MLQVFDQFRLDGKPLGTPEADAAWAETFFDAIRARSNGKEAGLTAAPLTDGKLLWKYPSSHGYALGAFTADGRQKLTVGSSDGLRLVSARDGTLIRQVGKIQQSAAALALRNDGVLAIESAHANPPSDREHSPSIVEMDLGPG